MNFHRTNNVISLANNYDIIKNKTAIRVISIFLLVLFMILGAYVSIRIYLSPIPITFQTMFVLIGAILLGKKLSTISQALYLGLGAIGLPVFSSFGAGILWFAGLTGGYLIGFILASFIIGILKTDKVFHSTINLIVLLLVGEIIIFTCGPLHLTIFYKYTLKNAFLIGVFPFIPGEIIKLCIAVGLINALKNSHFIRQLK